MFKNNGIRNILTALAVTAGGLILLQLTFLFAAIFQMCLHRFWMAVPDAAMRWFALGRHVLFLIVILLLSFVLFKTGLDYRLKAAFLAVPTAVTFVTIGLLLYWWPVLLYSVSVLLFVGILFYFYRTGKPWLYYYSVSWVSALLLAMMVMGVDI